MSRSIEGSAFTSPGPHGFAAQAQKDGSSQRIGRESRVNEFSGHQAALRQPGGYFWPEMRIGRDADYSDAYHWDYFINALASKNRRRGHAVPLGEVAIHYVTDTEMRSMILAQYPEIRRNIREARKVYRGIARDTRQFLRNREAEQNNLYKSGYIAEGMTAAIGRAATSTYKAADDVWLPTHMKLGPQGSRYSGYDGNKIGLNLSANRELFTEHAEILHFLDKEIGLDTSPIRKDWEPHATIFHLHPHLPVNGVVMKWPDIDQMQPDDYASMYFKRPDISSDNVDPLA